MDLGKAVSGSGIAAAWRACGRRQQAIAARRLEMAWAGQNGRGTDIVAMA